MSNRNWLLLILLASFWGASFLFTSIGLRSLDYLPLVTYRLSLAASALWLIAVVRRWQIPKGKIWLHYWVIGSCMCTIPFLLIAWGQQFVPSGLAAIFNAGTAIFGAALAPLFFKDESMSARKFFGVVIGFCGIVVAIGVDNLTKIDLFSLGQWAIVLATFFYAVGGIYAKLYIRNTEPAVNALGMVSMAAATLIFLLLAVYHGTRFVPHGLSWLSIFYLAIIGTTVAYLLYYYLLRKMGVAYVSLTTLIIPVFAIILGALVLGEKLQLEEYLGFALLALGLLIIDGRLFRKRDKS